MTLINYESTIASHGFVKYPPFPSKTCGLPEEIEIPFGSSTTEKESQFRVVTGRTTEHDLWFGVFIFRQSRSQLMSLEYYFKNLRCEHADATKLVLVRDNAAGSVRGAEQCDSRRRTRSSFFDLEDCALCLRLLLNG
jgi:hypothetical protein